MTYAIYTLPIQYTPNPFELTYFDVVTSGKQEATAHTIEDLNKVFEAKWLAGSIKDNSFVLAVNNEKQIIENL